VSNGAVFEEDAEILAHVRHEGGQRVLRLFAPKTSHSARPGQFVHLRVSPGRPLRRPFSIMLTDAAHGTVDILYKVVGDGTRELASRAVGETLPMLGPIGRPFDISDTAKRYVLIGGGVGMPPMIFAAVTLNGTADVVFFAGSEVGFPFALRPSRYLLPGIEGNTILAVASLDERGIPSRLAAACGRYGCYEGYVPDLARKYMLALDASERRRCELLACGPKPMLAATAALAREFKLPAQLSLEEYMACGVGGCAGCVVKTRSGNGWRYRRVCVDGPVFRASDLPEFG